jgi:beta-glucosidase
MMANFPPEFVWGAASASYQIEGAIQAEGKGRSVWDQFCHQPNRVWAGQSGEIACDHYHRFAEDIQIMADIGLQAYRFSLSWPRVLPEGIGVVNIKGLDFYDRLVDKLLAHHIQPWVTLFHWDFPDSLYTKGGWLNRESADWFADYVGVVVERLSDRVQHWITLNELQCFIGLGHLTGEHAPGLKLGFSDILRLSHHVLLAHGKAVLQIRAKAHSAPIIGISMYGVVKVPASNSPQDIQAATQAMAAVAEKTAWQNTWFADPVLLGHYPEAGLSYFQADLPPIQSEDLQTIAQPIDFLGLNIYSGQRVSANTEGIPQIQPDPVGVSVTGMDWVVRPESLYWGARFFSDRYQLPLVITENGMPNLDWVQVDGKVHDPQRIDFHTRYLLALKQAIAEGVKVQGYFVWSFTDNFEWAYGFKQRFGLVYIDYDTQARIPKDSAAWYKTVIQSHGDVISQSS